ncbi:MAG: hypothetical protein NTW47_17735 [Proteobacteria bacterium]|nr:hypothetical protein [Pseudomonadota bacterium]
MKTFFFWKSMPMLFLTIRDRGDQQHIVGERREKLRRHDDVKVKRA